MKTNPAPTSADKSFPRVLIVGAGTMGRGLARLILASGRQVVLTDVDEAVLASAAAELDSDRLRTTTDWSPHAGQVELAIESATEQPAPKEAVLRALGTACGPEVVIASNTSSFPVSELAAYVAHPERFLCLHFFNPPHLVRLCEVQGHAGTRPELVDRCVAWVESIGNHPVRIRQERAGFVANRLQTAILAEAVALVNDGVVSAAELDDIVTSSIGPRWAAVGPLSVADLGGLHVFASLMQRVAPSMADPAESAAVVQRMVDEGHLGARTNQGFYSYDDNGAAQRTRLMEAVNRLTQ